MAQVGLFFGTDTGTTRKIAKMMKKYFDDGVIEIMNVAKEGSKDAFMGYDKIIFGMPTLGDGELEDSVRLFLDELEGEDLEGKTIALYGLGDQDGYGHEFLDGMAIVYDAFDGMGATLIGSWPTDGYDFQKSEALRDGQFICLAIDNDNQADLNKERVEKWLEQVRGDLGI